MVCWNLAYMLRVQPHSWLSMDESVRFCDVQWLFSCDLHLSYVFNDFSVVLSAARVLNVLLTAYRADRCANVKERRERLLARRIAAAEVPDVYPASVT